jgi:23S rRNA (pseudouridine1915-N3)-methyltransferase
VDDYLGRLRRFGPVEEREVREAGRAGNPVAQRREEGVRLREAVPRGSRLIALDSGGRAWTSDALAARVESWRGAGPDTAFLIGGAEGLDPALRDEAAERWSLGPLTLPHELARVVVVEQLYRAATILAGQPYHKGA